MAMMLQLLIVAVAVGLSVDGAVPPYRHYLKAAAEAAEILQKNVLSMEGNIPFLDDYRRNYAEIMHVINYHAIMDMGCERVPYYEYYQTFVNSSAPEALTDPEEVVTEIGTLINMVRSHTTEIKKLSESCVQPWLQDVCDELVHFMVIHKENPYGREAAVLIAAGRVADELNAINEKFEKVSKDLKAHQYVCTSPQDLEIIEDRVAVLHQVLHPMPPLTKC